MLLVVFIECFP
uniref:Uncharacterized protein n=1 Tax=Rhizophora mucronata TaxID=61149 RepID=A0A2P2NWU7_RHIMU